ncbi:hypothetical protein ACOSQ3_022840 [Xanthoceras sorbifolium]
MSSPDDDSLIRDIELFKGLSLSSGESTNSEPCSLSVVTTTGVIDLEELESSMIRVVEGVRSTDQVSEVVPSTSRPLRFLPVNLVSRFTEFDLLRIRFQYGIPESVELRLPTPAERPRVDMFLRASFLTRLKIAGALLESSITDFFLLGFGLADAKRVKASAVDRSPS